MKVFRQIEPLDPATTVRGQYRGYVDEEGVHGGSDTETFVATRFQIESWRWAGVPWLLRAGKCLPVTATEAVVEFSGAASAPVRFEGPQPSRRRTTSASGSVATTASSCTCRRRPRATSTRPGRSTSRYATRQVFGRRAEAYQRLLEDAMEGDHRRFGRADAIEEQWRIVDKVLADPPPVRLYYKGTWGPAEADRLAADVGGWKEPFAPGEHPTG